MKRFLFVLSVLTFMFAFQAHAQEKCKVLSANLSGQYLGECKDGLANGKGIAVGIDKYDGQFVNGLPEGKGTYIWADGSKYKGDWKNGKRNGQGTFTSANLDSILIGLWENDVFKGEVKK